MLGHFIYNTMPKLKDFFSLNKIAKFANLFFKPEVKILMLIFNRCTLRIVKLSRKGIRRQRNYTLLKKDNVPST